MHESVCLATANTNERASEHWSTWKSTQPARERGRSGESGWSRGRVEIYEKRSSIESSGVKRKSLLFDARKRRRKRTSSDKFCGERKTDDEGMGGWRRGRKGDEADIESEKNRAATRSRLHTLRTSPLSGLLSSRLSLPPVTSLSRKSKREEERIIRIDVLSRNDLERRKIASGSMIVRETEIF